MSIAFTSVKTNLINGKPYIAGDGNPADKCVCHISCIILNLRITNVTAIALATIQTLYPFPDSFQ